MRAGWLAAALLPAAAAAQVAPWPGHDWRAQVLTPASRGVAPAALLSAEPDRGEIEQPAAVLAEDGLSLILRKSALDADPRVILDFGRAVGGYLEVGFSAPSARVLFAFSESLAFLGDLGDTFGDTSGIAAADRALPQRERRFESPHEHAAASPGTWRDPELRGGFRYLLLRLAPEAALGAEARIDFVRVEYRGLAGHDLADLDELYRGTFLCSQPGLNRMWYAGVNTLALATIDPAEGIENGRETIAAGPRVLVDGAKRDRLWWAGDLWAAARVSYASTFDLEAVRGTLAAALAARRIDGYLPACAQNGAGRAAAPRYLEYHLWWLEALLDYHLNAGDDAFFAAAWPALVEGIDWLDTRLATLDTSGCLAWERAFALTPGQRLGQDFRSAAPLHAAAAFLQTSFATGSAVTLRLRRDGPEGPLLAERRIDPLLDNAWAEVELPAEEPAGAFHLEASDPSGPVGWGGVETDACGDGQAFLDGLPVAGDRTLRYRARGGAGGPLVDTTGEPGHWGYQAGGRDAQASVLAIDVLRRAAEAAARRGQPELAARWAGRRAELAGELGAALWDEARGTLRRSPLEAASFPQDASALAAWLGPLAPARAARALDFLRDELATPYGTRAGLGPSSAPLVSPFLAGFEGAALFAAGRDAEAFRLLDRVWGHMLLRGKLVAGTLEPPSTTTWEHIQLDGEPWRGADGSLAHPWSAGATWLLGEYVLGIRPTAPGQAEYLVEPHPGTLRWAEGRRPTPRGAIEVRWRRAFPGFELELSAPPATLGRVALPDGGGRIAIADRGRLVWDGERYRPAPGVGGAFARPGYVELTAVAPGPHRFAATALEREGEAGFRPAR